MSRPQPAHHLLPFGIARTPARAQPPGGAATWSQDDGASFPVLEAVLVALLIVTTIIFFTSLQRPTTGTDVGGIDLGRLSADTLDILQTKEFTRATCAPLQDGLALEQWVGQVLNGTTCVADEVEDFLSEVLPPGTQFQLRLDNGVDPLVLVPTGSTETPRAARAASTYITPAWLAYKGHLASQQVNPGQQVAASETNATAFTTTLLCIKSPTGSSIGPSGATWKSVWQPAAPETPRRVPSDIPYGTWAGYAAADCSGTPTYLHVGLADGTATDHPVHGLQLVVGFGA